MITDKIKAALIAYLDTGTTLPVVDAQRFEEVELPCVTVRVSQTQKHSLALSKVAQIEFEVIYRAHVGDTATRAQCETKAEEISTTLIDPNALKTALNAIIEDGYCVDYMQFAEAYAEWDESTLEYKWEGECYAQKGEIA